MHSTSSMKLKDIRNTIKDFSPIKIYYNDKVVWDDDACESIKMYYKFWDDCAENIIYKFTIEIVHFHHSVIQIWGE